MGWNYMISIAIADDHGLFAEGVRNALHTQPDFDVKLVTKSGDELLRGLGEAPVDVALVDYEMPGGGAALVGALPPATRSIVVTMYPEAADSLTEAGAALVLSKSVPLSTLAAAIRAVHAGADVDEEHLESTLAEYSQPKLDPGAEALTDREVEVLRMLARGVSSTEDLAQALFISQKTVKNHLASIFQKLAVSDRTQAAIEAIRLGIAEPR